MHHLLRKQIILLFIFNSICAIVIAQPEIHREERDDVPYYFGLTLGYNLSSLHASKSTRFLQDDSILVAEPGNSAGIALGLSATARISKHFQLRFNPQLILGGARFFNYTLKEESNGEPKEQRKTLPTTLFSFPLHFKFCSDRIQNFRTYILFGGKVDVDLANNSAARNLEGLIKLKKYDLGLEAGVGFNIYSRWVTVSPELKISYGISDIHNRDANLKYSAVFDKIQTRMIVFTIHIEG